jgi:hypothetical protein
MPSLLATLAMTAKGFLDPPVPACNWARVLANSNGYVAVASTPPATAPEKRETMAVGDARFCFAEDGFVDISSGCLISTEATGDVLTMADMMLARGVLSTPCRYGTDTVYTAWVGLA